MANKKKLTLGELYELLNEEDVRNYRANLFFMPDGTDEEDYNTVWLSGWFRQMFKDWIVTEIGFGKGALKIVIDEPGLKSNAD